MENLEKLVSRMRSNFDNIIIEFLNKHGYDIEPPITEKKANIIKQQLAKQGLFLDYLEIITPTPKENTFGVTQQIIPIFNKINNPYTEAQKQEIIAEYKGLQENDKN